MIGIIPSIRAHSPASDVAVCVMDPMDASRFESMIKMLYGIDDKMVISLPCVRYDSAVVLLLPKFIPRN